MVWWDGGGTDGACTISGTRSGAAVRKDPGRARHILSRSQPGTHLVTYTHFRSHILPLFAHCALPSSTPSTMKRQRSTTPSEDEFKPTVSDEDVKPSTKKSTSKPKAGVYPPGGKQALAELIIELGVKALPPNKEVAKKVRLSWLTSPRELTADRPQRLASHDAARPAFWRALQPGQVREDSRLVLVLRQLCIRNGLILL